MRVFYLTINIEKQLIQTFIFAIYSNNKLKSFYIFKIKYIRKKRILNKNYENN